MTRRLIVAMTLLTALCVVFSPAPVATAHEGEGIITIESSTSTTSGRDYIVRLTWTNDGHPAVDATVTATAIATDGTPGTPVVLNAVDQDGRYGAEVPLPASGTWTVRITAVTPAALVEVEEQVESTTGTTSDLSSTTTGSDPTTTTTQSGATASTTTATEVTDTGHDGDGNGGIGVVIAATGSVAILIGIAIGVTSVRRHHSAE